MGLEVGRGSRGSGMRGGVTVRTGIVPQSLAHEMAF